MRFDPKEDAEHFGEDTLVYCNQHLRPHSTGWCTVPIHHKTALESKTEEEAVIECRKKGFKLYSDIVMEKDFS